MRQLVFISILLVSVTHIASAQDTIKYNPKLIPTLWVQQSAEYKALCYQAYNSARWQLDHLKRDKKDKRQLAIVTDIDETVLDNSYFAAQQITDNDSYSFELWKQWTDQAAATPIPGALEFFQYAKMKGIKIFYVSNRMISEVPATVKNLQSLGFPDADPANMAFKANTSSKEDRRKSIGEKYKIIMFIGDNLSDFSAAFEGQSNEQRSTEALKVEKQWGAKFIILPNPTYGDWESAFYDHQRGLSDAEKFKKMMSLLKGYPK